MIRPTIVKIVIALALLGPGIQASWGQQAGCFNTGSFVERNGWLPVTSANFDTQHQTGICRRQMVCASAVSFLTLPNAGRAYRNLCVRAFATDPWSDALSSVQP